MDQRSRSIARTQPVRSIILAASMFSQGCVSEGIQIQPNAPVARIESAVNNEMAVNDPLPKKNAGPKKPTEGPVTEPKTQLSNDMRNDLSYLAFELRALDGVTPTEAKEQRKRAARVGEKIGWFLQKKEVAVRDIERLGELMDEGRLLILEIKIIDASP